MLVMLWEGYYFMLHLYSLFETELLPIQSPA